MCCFARRKNLQKSHCYMRTAQFPQKAQCASGMPKKNYWKICLLISYLHKRLRHIHIVIALAMTFKVHLPCFKNYYSQHVSSALPLFGCLNKFGICWWANMGEIQTLYSHRLAKYKASLFDGGFVVCQAMGIERGRDLA